MSRLPIKWQLHLQEFISRHQKSTTTTYIRVTNTLAGEGYSRMVYTGGASLLLVELLMQRNNNALPCLPRRYRQPAPPPRRLARWRPAERTAPSPSRRTDGCCRYPQEERTAPAPEQHQNSTRTRTRTSTSTSRAPAEHQHQTSTSRAPAAVPAEHQQSTSSSTSTRPAPAEHQQQYQQSTSTRPAPAEHQQQYQQSTSSSTSRAPAPDQHQQSTSTRTQTSTSTSTSTSRAPAAAPAAPRSWCAQAGVVSVWSGAPPFGCCAGESRGRPASPPLRQSRTFIRSLIHEYDAML